MPGKGTIDFGSVLRLCEGLGTETTAFVEHLNTYGEYKEAVEYVRCTVKKESITIL